MPARTGTAVAAADAACIDPDRKRLLPAYATRSHGPWRNLRRLTVCSFALLRRRANAGTNCPFGEGCTKPAASRHMERIRRELRESVERALAVGPSTQNGNTGRAGLSRAEIELCFTYALEDWPLDLRSELSQDAGRIAPGDA